MFLMYKGNSFQTILRVRIRLISQDPDPQAGQQNLKNTVLNLNCSMDIKKGNSRICVIMKTDPQIRAKLVQIRNIGFKRQFQATQSTSLSKRTRKGQLNHSTLKWRSLGRLTVPQIIRCEQVWSQTSSRGTTKFRRST